MKIAIDISPLESGHKVRGTGFYLEYLKNALLKYQSNHEFIFFSGANNSPKNIDILHFPYFDPFFLTLPLVKKQKIVVTVHDLTPLVFPKHFPAGIKGSIKWQIQKKLLKQVDGIITDSESSKKDIAAMVGYPKEKIEVVYLAAGEEFRMIQDSRSKIQEVRKKYNLPEKFALYVGDVTWNKNLPRLVSASIKANIPLVLCGKALVQKNLSHNPWLNDFYKTLKLLKDQKNIFRLGFVPSDDLVALYNAATVFAMPSLYEGFGLPILEAMVCGVPVITTKNGSLSEVAGDAAYYVDPENIESIQQGLHAVFSNESLQKSLQTKGLEQVKNFSWKKTAQETVKVYEKIANKE